MRILMALVGLVLLSTSVQAQDVYDTLKVEFQPPVRRIEGTPLSLAEIAYYEVEVRDVVSDVTTVFLCEAGIDDPELFQDAEGKWHSSCSISIPTNQFYELAVGIIDTGGKKGLKYRTNVQFFNPSAEIPTDVQIILPGATLATRVEACEASPNCSITFNITSP